MKGLPEEVAPPRFMFRYLLPQIEKSALYGQSYLQRRARISCAHGCHQRILAHGRLCTHLPSQMEFKMSKTVPYIY